MKHLYKAFSGALLVLGLAGIHSRFRRWPTAIALTRPATACGRTPNIPPAASNGRRRGCGPTGVYVNRTRVVRGRTRLIQENRLIVHVRPVINREVVVHRTNTVVRDVILHRTNTTNKCRNEYHRQVVNRYVPGSVRHVVERREVRGVNCNCGEEGARYSGGYEGGYRGGRVVSYRD